MSIYMLCEQAVGLVRGKRLILTDKERGMLEALNYEGLTSEHAQEEAVICALHFGRVRDRLLQVYAWTFARKIASVAGGANLPEDLLTVLCVMVDGRPVDYEITAGRLNLTETAEVHYTAKISNPDEWSAIFRDVFVYSLAVEICAAVTGRPEYAQALEQKAQELITRARQIGAIQSETRITLRQEIFNRVIGLVRGHRTQKPTSEGAITQGIDTSGIAEWRPEAEINACMRSYESVRDRLLRSYAWTFARKTETPARLSEGVAGWKYTFVLPEDCIKVWNVIADDVRANDECGNGGKVELAEYEVAGRELYANRETVHIRYTGKVTRLEDLSAEFVEVYVYLLASEVALNVCDDVRMAQYFEQKAVSLVENAVQSGLINERSGLPLQRERRCTGFMGRPYLDYLGISEMRRTLCHEGGVCEFFGW